jgi:hypothetical protein
MESTEEVASAADAMGRRYATIWQMADNGLDANAIAVTTGQPVGEVELILALRRKARPDPTEGIRS